MNSSDIDLGLIFKEAQRMEKRQFGCNRQLWADLNVETLTASLPTQNLSGIHSLLAQHCALTQNNLPKAPVVEEISIENKIIVLIRKAQG